MKWIRKLREEDGFTIQEILVVLIVSSLLVSFGLELFLFTSKIVGKWTKKTERNSIINSTVQRIALDVEKSSSIENATDSLLILGYHTGKEVSFHSGENGVWRNDVRMTDLPHQQLLLSAALDSNSLTLRCVGSREVRLLRIKPPWSSRQEFSRALEGLTWNAESDRH